MTVVAADLPIGLVEVGGIGEGGRERVVVGGWERVARWGHQGFGVALENGQRGRAVVLVGGGWSSSGAEGLSLRQLVPEL